MDNPLSPEIVFRMLQPPVKGDERYPGVVNVPIQVTISPVHAVLQAQIDVTVMVLGGTATGTATYPLKIML